MEMDADATNGQTRIVRDPAILVGTPLVRGTRISVELILEYLARTPSCDQLFIDYPELTAADVQAALAYARDVVDGATAVPPAKRRSKGQAVRQPV